ncbi:MAG: hypothetical protein IJH34_14920 [Romboutsia sp.]|nr:hypothetical protein [Romboutsia sp.]
MKKHNNDYFESFLDACKIGDINKIERIIKFGIDINECVDSKLNLITQGILLALDNNQNAVIDYFIEGKLKYLKINPLLLIHSVKKENYKLLKIILDEYKGSGFLFEKNNEAYIDDTTTVLDSALCWAMEKNNDGMVNLLKEHIVFENQTYYASFISSCKNNYIEIAKIILNSEIDLTKRNSENKLQEVSMIDSALYWSIENNNKEIINYIMNKSDFDKKIYYASFILACKKGHFDIMKDIIEEGINLNQTHKEYELNETSLIDSALYWAIENSQYEIIDYLIAQKFDASKCDNSFINACIENNYKVIFSLLLNGFRREEAMDKFYFINYNDILDKNMDLNSFFINLDEFTSREEKELKYFLLKYIDFKENILIISKNKIKNNIKKLGNVCIENFDINKDFYKIKDFVDKNT